MSEKNTSLNQSTYEVVDRGGDGDCLFRAVLDHLLPSASNQQLRILAMGLRRLVANEEKRIAADIEGYRKRLQEAADNHLLVANAMLPANTPEQNIEQKVLRGKVRDFIKMTQPENVNRPALFENAAKIAKDTVFAENIEIVVLTYMLQIDIISEKKYYNTELKNFETQQISALKWHEEQDLFFYDSIPVIDDRIRIQCIGNYHYVALRDPKRPALTPEQQQNKIRILTLIKNYLTNNTNIITNDDQPLFETTMGMVTSIINETEKDLKKQTPENVQVAQDVRHFTIEEDRVTKNPSFIVSFIAAVNNFIKYLFKLLVNFTELILFNRNNTRHNPENTPSLDHQLINDYYEQKPNQDPNTNPMPKGLTPKPPPQTFSSSGPGPTTNNSNTNIKLNPTEAPKIPPSNDRKK